MKMMITNPAKKILPSVVKASNYTTVAADLLLRPPPPSDADLRKQPQSMGDPCLDLYFGVQVQPDPATRTRMAYKYLNQVLPMAWSHNPLTTLKLICNLRDDSNDLGKSDEKAFYSAALWLHRNHPKTLACNAASIAGEFTESVGTMDDFVQILNRLARAGDRYERDSDYRFLLDRVSDLFADHLRSDMRNLKQQPYMDISSAALYCPPIGSSLDRSTLLCESIARILFPREESCPEEEYQGLDYAQRVRARLRTEVLVPLTNFLLSNSSLTHRGFCPVKKYLDELKGGLGQPIEPGALLPHDIIGYVDDEDVGQAAELQWRRMVEDIYLKQGNKLSNCLAVCNVSPTVAHTNVSVALSVLASQLSEEPWKGKVINFSPNPQLHNLATPQGDDDLKSKCAFVRRMHCALEIDLGKVFDLILEVAVDGNLRPDQMIKKVLVLTDFQTIDLAESDYEAIQNKFKVKGYEDAVPQIVYWKLQSWGTPVAPCRRPGVSTLDGFSDNLLKLFLDSNGEVGPYHVMEAAISGKEYENLAVCD
ncbi:hypothetical protein ACFX13_000109 [Malus domestica]